ncbi:MAG: prefoldin subunit beta [Candidatus Thermoplasmatota archaeon]
MVTKFEDLPPQVQNQLRQLQQLQQQMELLLQQKLQIEIRLRDAEDALDELNKLEENADVYKGVGNLIVKSEKDRLIKELQEEKENLEIRKKTMESQENRLKEKINELQSKIQEALKPTQ